jgi:hypothetical protein
MMSTGDLKRHMFRGLLVFHFIGLALTIGIRFANFAIYHATSTADLQQLSFGRDLAGEIARDLSLPGLLMMMTTGLAMTFMRYGLRPPIWIWLKLGLTVGALALAAPVVAPALEAAREWARWSVAQGHLAPEFHASVSKANLYGSIVFLLFLLNIPVAVWKPFASLRRSLSPKRDDASRLTHIHSSRLS